MYKKIYEERIYKTVTRLQADTTKTIQMMKIVETRNVRVIQGKIVRDD